jgi:chemotaxis protein CheD
MPDQMDIFLQPGEYYVGGSEYRIRTLLGSCVSITLWHPLARVGGMSHFLLAERGARPVLGLDGRYGEEAMQLMLNDLRQARVDPSRCQAKLVGGGDMFPRQGQSRSPTIGHRNGEAARSLLRAHNIPIVSESLFGTGHRQVVFDVATGDVWVRQIRPTNRYATATRGSR